MLKNYLIGYPGTYPHNRNCFWLVRVPLGKRIQFHFATIRIETHNDCSYDFLKIYDGETQRRPILATYCTTQEPAPLTTSGPFALVYFHTDGSVTDHGFHITYSAIPGIPGCGGALTAPRGSFSSPNFPELYDNNIDCEWIISSSLESKIQLKFTSFELEEHGECQFDYVEVYDGDAIDAPFLGRYCSNNVPPPVVSTGSTLRIRFIADQSVTRGGFRAEYVTICGGLYTDLQGIIKSPYFPDHYPAGRTCVYHIQLPVGNLVHLEFQDFALEGSRSCSFDFVEIRESGSENGTQISKLCGTTLPDPITSTYNELWLSFKTDGSYENRGFLANYTNIPIGCGGVYRDNHGIIATPNHPDFYPSTSSCSWLIRAPRGHIVRLTFTVFVVEYHFNCSYDSVEVRDTNSALIGRFCGNRLPPTLTSSGNEMLITFTSDHNQVHEGFAAAYAFFDASTTCGGNFFSDVGEIMSPGYPEHYPPSRDCEWILHAHQGHQVMLHVLDFDMEAGTNCNFDFLEIRNGGDQLAPLVGKFCGRNNSRTAPMKEIISHSNQIYLRFRTDTSMTGRGFHLLYDTATTGCGGTLTSPTGTIISPGYPQPYGHDAECNWIIRVSQGSKIALGLVDIDIESHINCAYDYVEIFDGNSDKAPRLAKVCNDKNNPHFIVSSKNVAFVKFRTDSSQNGRGFRINYQLSCNNTLRGFRGVIESPVSICKLYSFVNKQVSFYDEIICRTFLIPIHITSIALGTYKLQWATMSQLRSRLWSLSMATSASTIILELVNSKTCTH